MTPPPDRVDRLGRLERAIAEAILGVDTLFGGDVTNPSGTGRFIADAWFSDEPLPAAYTHPERRAAARQRGSVGQVRPTALRSTPIWPRSTSRPPSPASPRARARSAACAADISRGSQTLAVSCGISRRSSSGAASRCPMRGPSKRRAGPRPRLHSRRRSARRWRRCSTPAGYAGDLLAAVERWRRDRLVPRKSIPALARAFIAELDAATAVHLLPHLPPALSAVPRANVTFLPIENAWFSGSMNYLGRARKADGSPEYEATYELNAALEISVPEFVQLVAHEVEPGHVTTFAFLQQLYGSGAAGFEASVPTMNTRAATLSEGIANNAILIAHGVTEIADLGDPDLELGLLLALLQDDAKNQASWLTWQESWPQAEVAAVLPRDFLVTPERADKLSGAWGRHPLLGRMYLPCYRAGTERVAELRRRHAPAGKLLPAIYGAQGLVDIVTVDEVLAG